MKPGFAAVLVALLASACFTAPAIAQVELNDLTEAQEDEMYCVYDSLVASGDHEQVAEAYIYTDLTDDQVDEADEALEFALWDCSDDYEWDEEHEGLAEEIGQYGSVVDYLHDDLLGENVSEAGISAITGLVDKLPEADLNKFYDTSWLDDEAFKARMRTALIVEGIPNESFVLDTSIDLMESSLLLANAMIDWLDLL
jgi:hypothetical protein